MDVTGAGTLATIASEEENRLVFGLVNTPAFFIIGNGFGPALGAFQPPGSREPEAGRQWASGEPWVFSNWAPRQPDGWPGEDYLNSCGFVGPTAAGLPETPAPPNPLALLTAAHGFGFSPAISPAIPPDSPGDLGPASNDETRTSPFFLRVRRAAVHVGSRSCPLRSAF